MIYLIWLIFHGAWAETGIESSSLNTILEADSHSYLIFTLLVLLTVQSTTDAAKEVKISQTTTSLKDLKLIRIMLYIMCT